MEQKPKKHVMIVPYRDRKKQLDIFLEKTLPRLNKYLNNVEVLIIEQEKGKPFNRGKVLNIGVKESDYDSYLYTHDVDVHPFRHTIYNIYDQKLDEKEIIGIYTSKFDTLGGIIKFKKKTFEIVNGFPNNYWGWGMEDKALQNRVEFMNINIKKSILQDTLNENDYFLVNDKDIKRVVSHDAQEKHNFVYKDFKKLDNMGKYKSVFNSGLNNLEYRITNKEQLMENVKKITVEI